MNLKFGKITEVDPDKGLAKVTFEEDDNLVTAFLPMSVPKSARDKYSIPFDVNEHVWCIMDDACEDGVIGGAIYDAQNKPSGLADKTSVQFEGNMRVEYDRSTATLKISGGELVTIQIDNSEINVQDGILIKRGDETLKKIFDDLIDEVNKIVVPTNVGPSGTPINAAAFTAIKTRAASLLK